MKVMLFWVRKGARKPKMQGLATAAGSAATIYEFRRNADEGKGRFYIVEAKNAEHGRRMIAAHKAGLSTGAAMKMVDGNTVALGSMAVMAIGGANESLRNWNNRISKRGRVTIDESRALRGGRARDVQRATDRGLFERPVDDGRHHRRNPMRRGTNHFRSKHHAVRYYQLYDPGSTRREINRWVEQKLRVGEIRIGPPRLPFKGRLYVDEDGRYHIETEYDSLAGRRTNPRGKSTRFKVGRFTVQINDEGQGRFTWAVLSHNRKDIYELSGENTPHYEPSFEKAKAVAMRSAYGPQESPMRGNPRGIPRVREWIVRVGGRRYRVLAPTKYLAKLNLREHYPTWGFPITSIGVARKEIGQREMVVDEGKA